jgi:hypothetical protein
MLNAMIPTHRPVLPCLPKAMHETAKAASHSILYHGSGYDRRAHGLLEVLVCHVRRGYSGLLHKKGCG